MSLFINTVCMIKIACMILLLSHNFAHNCSHHSQSGGITPEIADTGLNPAHNSSTEPISIRIKMDFTNSLYPSENSKMYVETTLSNQALKHIRSVIKVKNPTGIKKGQITFKNPCNDFVVIPDQYVKQNTDVDLIVLVKSLDDNNSTLASSNICSLDRETGRPIMAILYINMRKLEWGAETIDTSVSVLLHELTHIVGFSPWAFKYFPKSANGVIKYVKHDNVSSPMIVSPAAVEFAKTYFDCPSLEGLPLENEGSDGSVGSHFEKTVFGNELMTAKITGRPVLSPFALKVLEDSNWYEIDYSFTEALVWGRNRGCDFVYKNNCDNKYPEFCNENKRTYCSTDYTNKAQCRKTTFSDSCLVKEYDRAYSCFNMYNFMSTVVYEETGANSRCFETQLLNNNSAGCFVSRCKGSTIEIEVDDTVLECTQSYQKITYKTLTITCPKIEEFCGLLEETCTSDCSGRGRCLLNKNCYCDYFYGGEHCEKDVGCKNGDNKICKFISQIGRGVIISSAPVLRLFGALLVIATLM